jgi:Domain of unknown function (DUF6916)
MDGALTLEEFAKCVNQTCKVHYDSGNLEMTLVECRKLSILKRSGHREPFALLFRGPKNPVLVQRTYQFDFEGLGTVKIFIVPIGSDSSGIQYEAIFA